MLAATGLFDVPHGIGHPIEDDRHQYDRQPAFERLADIKPRQPLEHDIAEARRADESSQHD